VPRIQCISKQNDCLGAFRTHVDSIWSWPACIQFESPNASVWQKYGELPCNTGNSQAGAGWLLKAQQANLNCERIDVDPGIASLSIMDGQNAERFLQKAARLHPNGRGRCMD